VDAATTARHVGVQFAGETDAYHDRVLHVYRARSGDLATDAMAAVVAAGDDGARCTGSLFDTEQPTTRPMRAAR